MSTVQEIEEAIAKLKPEEFSELAFWIDERRDDAWDRQMKEDASSGRLDHLWTKAKEQIHAGEVTTLDEFLHH